MFEVLTKPYYLFAFYYFCWPFGWKILEEVAPYFPNSNLISSFMGMVWTKSDQEFCMSKPFCLSNHSNVDHAVRDMEYCVRLSLRFRSPKWGTERFMPPNMYKKFDLYPNRLSSKSLKFGCFIIYF